MFKEVNKIPMLWVKGTSQREVGVHNIPLSWECIIAIFPMINNSAFAISVCVCVRVRVSLSRSLSLSLSCTHVCPRAHTHNNTQTALQAHAEPKQGTDSMRVRVEGLSKSPQYNGLLGTIRGEVDGRLRVVLDQDDKVLSLKRENLVSIEEPPEGLAPGAKKTSTVQNAARKNKREQPLRFSVGTSVICNLGTLAWTRGRVIKQNYQQPVGIFHPYQVHMYVCIYGWIHMHIYTYIYIYIHTCIHTYVYISTHMYNYIDMYIYTYISIQIPIYINICLLAYTCININVLYIYICVYTCM